MIWGNKFFVEEQWASWNGCREVVERAWGHDYFTSESHCRGELEEWDRNFVASKNHRKIEITNEIEQLRLLAGIWENFYRLRDLEDEWAAIAKDDVNKWRQRAKQF